MRNKIILLSGLLMLFAAAGSFGEEAIYTEEFSLSFYPAYRPAIGQKINLRLRTFKPANKVTLYSDREIEIPMAYRQGYWYGDFQVPQDYKTGGHFFSVWIKYPFAFQPKKEDLTSKVLGMFGFKKKIPPALWTKSIVWYQAEKMENPPVLPTEASFEAGPEFYEEIPIITGEGVEIKVPSPEAIPFIIKGSKTLSFSSKNIEGSKEGFVPAVTREESLRLNIAGKSDGTEVDATLISTSTLGTAQVAQREEKISVLLKRASTEAYLGDFTADLTDTEFTKLNKVLSGVRLKGDYDRWGFSALYSSPKGEGKNIRMYGDGTQGPYRLDAAPAVIDSERIFLDGTLQKRGDDYTIDYQAGTFTFVRKTIDPKSILNIYYDYSQTVYQHATYGGRIFSRPSPNMKIGLTYLNDSDYIPESPTQEAIPPRSHFVAGADGSLVSEWLTANGEIAYSNKNMNLLSAGGSEETGKALKLDLASQVGAFGLTLHGKRVGAKFESIADPNPKQDITEYGAALSFRPNPLFRTQGSYDRAKYSQSGVVYDNLYKNVKAGLTPDRLPSLEYNFSEQDESNDPVSGSGMQRTITRNSAETLYRFGFLSSSLKGASEKWLRRTPSEEVTDYRRINVGLATVGLEKLTFTSNLELENRQEPGGETPYRKTCNLNFSIAPAKPYFISTSIEYLDDSAQGIKSVADLSYRAEPNSLFKTDGKYTITTVKEDFATSETVAKHTGSFSLDYRPVSSWRLRYLYKPNYTKVIRMDALSYNNEQQQAELNFIPLKEAMLGMLYRTGHSFNALKQDFAVKQNTADTDSTLYTLKMAPFQIFSTEFDYLIENGKSTALVTEESPVYLPGQTFGKKLDVMVKTSLSEKISIDSRYTNQISTQGTGEATANLTDSVSHTAFLKGIWNASDCWSFSLAGSYTRTRNNLADNPVTYTYAPGFGIVFRQGDRLRVDFDYIYSKSYAGSEAEKINYALRGKYSLSDYVNITLRSEHEVSRAPDYKLTDITGNVEINL